MRLSRPSGMLGFTVVWVGQAVSLLGTSMSAFALTIWAYQLTGKATAPPWRWPASFTSPRC